MKRARTDAAKDERRLALLEAALEEFYQRGFSAARMDDVAARAGVSKGTLYLYFKSKDELFKAIVDTFAIPNVEHVESMAAMAPTGLGGLRSIARFAPTLIRHSRVPKLMKILVGDSTAFPETVRTYRVMVLDRLLGVLSGALARAHEAGEAHVPDPALTARIVIAPIALSGMWHVLFGDDPDAQVDLESLFELHVDLLQRALAVPDTGWVI